MRTLKTRREFKCGLSVNNEMIWSAMMWSELKWFMWSDFILKWSEVKWSEVKSSGVTVKFLGTQVRVSCTLRWIILRALDYIVTISFDCTLYCGCFKLFCNVCICMCVGFVMHEYFGNMCTCISYSWFRLYYVFLCCFVYVYLFLFVLSVLV